MSIGEKIYSLRKKAGMSQEELAEVLGVSRQAVSKWETGEATPEVGKLLLLSRTFGVTADWLISEDAGEPESEAREDPGETDSAPEGQAREDTAAETSAAGTEPREAGSWVDSVPGFLGRMLRKFGWLFGVRVAIAGGAFTVFGVIARVLVKGFMGSMGSMMGGMAGGLPGGLTSPGTFWESDGIIYNSALTGTDVSVNMSSPFLTFANVFIVLGVLLIITGVVLAVALKRYGDRK